MIKNALLIFGICAAIFVFFLPSYLSMQDLSAKNSTYERKIRDLTKANEDLQEERRRLLEDPAYFEKVAREKMGLIKDGETIYKIVPPEQKKADDARAAAEAKEAAKEALLPSPESATAKKQAAASKTKVKKSTKKKSSAVKKTSSDQNTSTKKQNNTDQ
ncbi:MAG: septum formation initiator family protein [Candidatus Omnitrophica bacterium]|nr:septum formation initiator family protein [Candidatus Omnitrophota bacterium]